MELKIRVLIHIYKDYIERPDNQQRAERTQDEYIQTHEEVQRNALYNVSNVRNARRFNTGLRFQTRRSILSGEQFSEKIVDVVLSPGVKKLEIFAQEE